MNDRVKADSLVTLHYRLATADDTDLVSTFAGNPSTLQLGNGELAPTLEACLDGLPVGGGEVRLDDEQSEGWLRALTDARLALGLRLNITDETDLEVEIDEAVLRDPTSARVGHLSVYAYLTYLQESLVGALLDEGKGRRRDEFPTRS